MVSMIDWKREMANYSNFMQDRRKYMFVYLGTICYIMRTSLVRRTSFQLLRPSTVRDKSMYPTNHPSSFPNHRLQHARFSDETHRAQSWHKLCCDANNLLPQGVTISPWRSWIRKTHPLTSKVLSQEWERFDWTRTDNHCQKMRWRSYRKQRPQRRKRRRRQRQRCVCHRRHCF